MASVETAGVDNWLKDLKEGERAHREASDAFDAAIKRAHESLGKQDVAFTLACWLIDYAGGLGLASATIEDRNSGSVTVQCR